MYCFVPTSVHLRTAQHVRPNATSPLRQSTFRLPYSVHRQLPLFSIQNASKQPNHKRRVASITMEEESRVFKNAATNDGDSIVEYQLSKVPIFTVTDETGRPFLAESDDHRLRLGYFFVQPADAQRYLERVKSDNSDAKVLTIGLNEAVKFLETKSTPAKSIPERFQLFPDEHEAEIAQEVTAGAFQKTFGSSGVPIFYVDGLGIKDGKQDVTVFPLFFEKEKLDETIGTLKKQDPKATIDLKDMQVIDLRQTIKEIRTGGNPKLNNVVFVPLSESLKAMREKAAQ